MAFPLVIPALGSISAWLGGLSIFGGGYALGNWNSNGWLKWAIILVILVALYFFAKKQGWINV